MAEARPLLAAITATTGAAGAMCTLVWLAHPGITGGPSTYVHTIAVRTLITLTVRWSAARQAAPAVGAAASPKRCWGCRSPSRRPRVSTRSPSPSSGPSARRARSVSAPICAPSTGAGWTRSPPAFADLPAGFKERIAAQVPIGRLGEGAETATAALFLASADSSFVTGIDLPVEGGIGQV